MTSRARLLTVAEPHRGDPEAVVLVLHGGGSRGAGVPVDPRQLSVLRMLPVARRVAGAGRGRFAVLRLLNSTRGWDEAHPPTEDVAWALAQVRERYPEAPVGLVGHSLGGRSALLSLQRDAAGAVRSVVALAPWVHAHEGRFDAGGRHVLLVTGTGDRVADPERAAAVARDLAATARVGLISVDGGTHAMLRHRSAFDGSAAGFLAATLLGDTPRGPVADVLGGSRWVEV